MLTTVKRQMRIQISAANLLCLQGDNENFISRLITHDETWIYHYNLESKAQSKVWENTTWEVKAKSISIDGYGLCVVGQLRHDKKDYFEHGKTVAGNTSV